MPKISVIIPVYNAIQFLPDTLSCVLNQTFTDFEVIIVDDGSNDESADWVAGVSDSRISLIRQANQGTQGARNTGVRHAQGEYIALLDNDDLWEPTKLEKQFRCLEQNPSVGLVYTWTSIIDQHDKRTGETVVSHADGDVFKQLLVSNFVACGSTPLIRRVCFEQVGVFDCELHYLGDWDMWIRIARHYPFAVIKEFLVLYRVHASNTSNNYEKMEIDFCKAIEKAYSQAPGDLESLKSKCYSRAYHYLSCKAIGVGNYHAAAYFHQRSIDYFPSSYAQWSTLRLGIAINTMKLLGPDVYSKLRSLSHALRRNWTRSQAQLNRINGR
jgi:glycosyltransferase involved in cell wall biosynthesis